MNNIVHYYRSCSGIPGKGNLRRWYCTCQCDWYNTGHSERGGLVCVDTSRDTGQVTGVALSWYRDGIRLQRQTSSSLQSYLGWSTYFEFNLRKRIWLKRDEDTVATEGVFFCRLGTRAPFEATVSVGVYYPSECGYFLHNFNKCIHIHLSPGLYYMPT